MSDQVKAWSTGPMGVLPGYLRQFAAECSWFLSCFAVRMAAYATGRSYEEILGEINEEVERRTSDREGARKERENAGS